MNILFLSLEALALIIVPLMIAMGMRLIVQDIRTAAEQEKVKREKARAQERAMFEGAFKTTESTLVKTQATFSKRWADYARRAVLIEETEIPAVPFKRYWEGSTMTPRRELEPGDLPRRWRQ